MKYLEAIKYFANLLKEIGTQGISDTNKIKQIVFVNQIALLFILASIPFITTLFLLGHFTLGLIAFPAVMIFFSCYVLHFFKKQLLAKLVLNLGIMIPTFIYTYLLGLASGIQYVYLLSVTCSYGMFHNDQPKLRIYFSTIPILLFCILLFITPEHNTYFQVSKSHLRYIYIVSTALIFTILLITGKFYIKLSEKYKQQTDHLLTLYNLTEREGEILELIIKGLSNKKISDTLFIEEGTVKNHLHRIYTKFSVTSRLELLAKVLKKNALKNRAPEPNY